MSGGLTNKFTGHDPFDEHRIVSNGINDGHLFVGNMPLDQTRD